MSYRAIKNFIIDKESVSIGQSYDGDRAEALLNAGLIEYDPEGESSSPEMAESGGEGQSMDEPALSPPKKSKKKKE